MASYVTGSIADTPSGYQAQGPPALPTGAFEHKWPITGSVQLTGDDFMQITSTSGSGAPIAFASGSTDTFHRIAPPFISGLIPGLKVWHFDPHVMGVELPAADNLTTSPWLFDDATGTVARDATDADFDEGALSSVIGGSTNHQTAIYTKATPFRCATGKQFWLETEFKMNLHDKMEFFFGISEQVPTTNSFHLVAAGAGADRVGFVKAVHNDDTVTFAASKNGGGTITTAMDTGIEYDTNMDILHLGIHWDGNGNIGFYGSIRAAGTKRPALTLIHTYSTAAGISDDADMHLVYGTEQGDNGAAVTLINFIKGAIWT